jgi:transposase
MDYGAIDLHKRRSQVRIVHEDGTVVWTGGIATTRAALTTTFGPRARLRILVESSTESEWVAQHLETLGHEVIVADPGYAAMYSTRSRKVKTDGRDVAALAEACRTGVYRRAHRASPAARALRRTLGVRRHLVQTRTGLINMVRALLRQEGLRLPSGASERLVARLDALAVPPALATVLAPLRTLIAALSQQIHAADQACADRSSDDPVAQHLLSAPGVGPIVALTFEAVLDDPARFGGDAARASAFLGLVPSEDSSAERRHRGHITKAGPPELRALLVQAGWAVWRGTRPEGAALRRWAHALAARRGRRIAVVALARRLARILFALWRDRVDYREPTPRVG